jgi:cation diffusion facilitator CzcD-associated flavoprotein CzcO
MTPRASVAVVGAGFSGIAVTAGLLRAGVSDVVVLERGPEVGGAWRDNTYPGCACDVPSHLYSFSWAPEPSWSRTFSPQQEIEDYLVRVSRETGVRERTRFGVEVTSAAWDDAARCWHLDTTEGSLDADILVSAGGALVEPAAPDVPGLDTFAGPVFHSARWRHDVDLAGLRVAVVGTGASAIQVVPALAPVVGSLAVLQRTPPWILPRNDRAIAPAVRERYRRWPALQRAARAKQFAEREITAPLFVRDPRLMALARRQGLGHLRAQVADPALRAALTPDYEPGCKRILTSDDYYPALQRDNVRLHTSALASATPGSLVTADGHEFEVDAVVLATGFDVYDPPMVDVTRGRDGRTLAEHWAESMQAYLGTAVAGFPNLFLMVGPNVGLGHTSMVLMIEAQARYVVDAVSTVRRSGLGAVEVTPQAQRAFNEWIDERMARTVWLTGGCRSWYLDGEGRNGTLWPASTVTFRRRTRRFDVENYTTTPAAGAVRVAP